MAKMKEFTNLETMTLLTKAIENGETIDFSTLAECHKANIQSIQTQYQKKKDNPSKKKEDVEKVAWANRVVAEMQTYDVARQAKEWVITLESTRVDGNPITVNKFLGLIASALKNGTIVRTEVGSKKVPVFGKVDATIPEA